MTEETKLVPCKKCNRDEKHLERFSADGWCSILCACGHSGPIQISELDAELEWNRMNAADELGDEIDHEAEERYWLKRDEQG